MSTTCEFCESSLTSGRTRESPRLAAIDEAGAPGLVRCLDRGEDVQEHAVGEEGGDLLPARAGDTLDVGDEVAEAVADDGGDRGIPRGGVRLHLGPQVGAVGLEQLA